MMMINYANEEIEYQGCPSCAYTKNEFELPCGRAFESERFILSQDWELPIQAFFVVAPKRHIEKFEELDKEEKTEMFEIVDKTIKILRKNNICERFDVIFEEKADRHFHVWILPRHQWMTEEVGSIIANIGKVCEYARVNMRTEENYQKIKEISDLVKKHFDKE